MIRLLNAVAIVLQHLFQHTAGDPVIINDQYPAPGVTRVQFGWKRSSRVTHSSLMTVL